MLIYVYVKMLWAAQHYKKELHCLMFYFSHISVPLRLKDTLTTIVHERQRQGLRLLIIGAGFC